MLKPENNKLKDENTRRDIVLSKTALTVIEEASKLFEKTFGRKPTDDDLIFCNRKGVELTESALRNIVIDLHEKRKSIDGKGWVDSKDGERMITLHGFRSTFMAFGMSEGGFIKWVQKNSSGVIVLDHVREAIEFSLLHNYDPSGLSQAYVRHDMLAMRSRLAEAFSALCTDWEF